MILRSLQHARRRWLSTAAVQRTSDKPFFVTTPIFYVNAAPHIGHLYSAVIADATVRFQRLLGRHPAGYHLCTGTDEHGSKIQQAAAAHQKSESEYCADISGRYRHLFDRSAIAYTDFVRTTEERHSVAVAAFWRRLEATDSIYSAQYEGWYCVPDETFLTDGQLTQLPDGRRVSAESGHPVEWTEEQNYMFRMSRYQSDVIAWLRDGEKKERVRPARFAKQLLEQLEQEPLPDVSVSRPRARVHWGLPVPGDEGQTVYVWLDALVNYLTVAGWPEEKFVHNWPPAQHVIGKDILKFHGIYWPAFLIAAGLEPPQQLHVHSHWTVDDQKMSKSKGNVVDPAKLAETFGFDGLRYFLLREGTAHSDGNYSEVKLQRILNSELADTLGNLLSRGCAPTVNVRQAYPHLDPATFDERLRPLPPTAKLIRLVAELPERCHEHFGAGNFYLACDAIVETLHAANAFFETLRPWELKKSKSSEDQILLDTVLATTLEVLRVCGIALQPIVPQLSGQLLDKLAVGKEQRMWSDMERVRWSPSAPKVDAAHAGEEMGWQERLLDAQTEAILFRRVQKVEEVAKPAVVSKRRQKKERV